MGKIDELLRRCPLLPHVRQELAGRFLIALMLAGMALLVVDLRIHTGGSVYLLYSVPLVLSLFIARRGSSYAVMGTITALILVGLIMRYLWVQPTTPPANAHVISGFVAIVCGWAVAIVLERDRAAVMRLADQEADLRLMADIGPTLIAHLDVDLRYIRVNRVFEEWFGLTSEQVRGKTGKEILGEKAWQAIAPYIEQAMAGRTATYEQFMTYAGGREFWVHATLTPEKDDGGRVIGLVVHAIDISDRKKVEDRLRLSEARISAFISQSPLATIVFAPDGRPIETNRAWEETFGYGLEEIREYNALDDKEMEAKGVMSYVRRGFGGEAVAIPAFRYQPTGPRMAGRDWSIKAYIYPVRDDAGAVSRVVMTMIDLTQLEDVEKHLQETLKEAGKTAEAARQRSRALETIFRSIPELIAVYDNPGGILRFASQMYLDFYGLRSDAVGTAQLEQVLASVPMSRIDDHGSVDVDQRPVYRALRKGETVAHDELGVTKPDGSRVVLLAAAAPVRNDQGDIAYAVVAYRDITANRATAEALQASEYELRTLVENTPDLIARFDARGRYTYANPAFERMSGLIQDQLAGKTNSELGMPSSTEAVLRDALERAAGTRRETNVEFRFAGLFGERHFQGKVIPEFGPKGQVASSMLVARDITEIKQAEEHVKFISFHDTVTGLYTRTYLEEEVTRIDTERQLPISVIAGDANNLKLMNDAFGHEEGDRLLRSIANAARACCRDEDIIARWGG